MHHFIYPSKDTYITNETSLLKKNFGLDELLEIKANTQLRRVTTYNASSSISTLYHIPTDTRFFTGSVDGYVSGSDGYSYLLISGSANVVVSGYFNGQFTGSYDGGATLTGSYSNQSGHYSGSISGSISGSWSGCIHDVSGSLDRFSGLIQGTLYGTQSIYSPSIQYTNIPQLSRALVKFDVTSISKSIADGTVDSGSLEFRLRMRATSATELPLSYSIYAYPVSQSWEMGDGKYETGGSDLGASWYYRSNAVDGVYWSGLPEDNIYDFTDYLTTSSNASKSFTKGGGTWYYNVPSTYSSASSGYCQGIDSGSSLISYQSFDYEASDLNIDVTDIVKSWICGCIPNNGIILLSSLELSQIENSTGTIRFFSSDTNTIYAPALDAHWDDSIYITGSLSSVNLNSPFVITIKNLNKTYRLGEIPRIDIFARDKNPLKNFVRGYQMNQYLTSSLLPSSSYYAIKDNESEITILDFDDSTKISCDGNMHYFKLDTTSLAHERYYRILIKTVLSGSVYIFDNNNVFKISR